MAAQSLPGPSSSKPIWNYDVFLSFRGKDTRKNFTDHLYTALVKAGIHTFRDDEELRRGKEISSELLNAIEESRISIVVFSKGYASSSWCLDELVKIMECKNSIGQTVFPIFYDVDPSHVRHQTSSFADVFAHHEKRFNMEKMQKWRAALTQAANLSGDDLRNVANGYEAKFIQKFVEEVSNMVNPAFLNVDIHLIGIDSRVKEMKALLNVGRSDVRIVGIYGMGGIGKTTIAKAVYNEILYQFDGRSFLNIKDHLEDHNGLVHLQEQLLSDILQTKNLKIGNSDIGINIIKKKLCNKRVLIFLDDEDHLEQLYSLVGNYIWFGSGSRVIITTRDESLLTTKVGVNEKYRVEKLNHDESLQLFSWHAFNNSHPIEKYLKPSKHIVNYVGGLPLALKVLGSSCFDNESMKEWEETLEKLQKHPDKKIQDILRISFDSLDDTMKDIFLDIACFFVGMKKEYAIKILDGRGFFPYTGMRTLIKRSLVTIGSFNELRMHNLLRDMGRKIVRDGSPNNPGEHTRLWFHEDVINVLKKQTGSEAVEGLVLFRHVDLKTEEFAKMKRLRLLQINDVNLSGCFEHLSQELILALLAQVPSDDISTIKFSCR